MWTGSRKKRHRSHRCSRRSTSPRAAAIGAISCASACSRSATTTSMRSRARWGWRYQISDVETKMKLRKLSVLLLVLAPPSGVAACTIHDNMLASNFHRVNVGMQERQVLSVLGTPHTIGRCEAPFQPWRRPDCAKSYLYPSWGEPLLPITWIVWFDASGTAIDKARFESW